VPHAAEKVREVAPAAAGPEQRRGAGIPEDAGRDLSEDSVARERAQDPMQRVPVRSGFAREVGDGARAVGERICDPEVGCDPERTRHECAAH